MLRRIDVREIVSDHLRTLSDYASGRRSIGDILLFFILPLFVASAMLWECVLIQGTLASIILTSLAIFAGLLFNLLLLVHGMIRSVAPDATDEKRLIREIYSNISYAILIAIIVIIDCLASFLPAIRLIQMGISATAFYLVTNFLLTLLMILRRIHILLSREFQRT